MKKPKKVNFIKSINDFVKSIMKLFNRKKQKRTVDLEDMIWAIKMLMMSDKEIERMVNNFRNAVLEFNK